MTYSRWIHGTVNERQQMNAEQVCEMIDAITEGKPYDFKLNDDVTISIGDWVTVYVDGIGSVAKTNDPRTAREIAAALVAWADMRIVADMDWVKAKREGL